MPDILIQPNADADDDLTNAIVMDDVTLPLSDQGAVALGLTLGTTYKARVLGAAETFSVAVPATAPAQMSAPTVTATGANSISVDRAAAPADGGSAITSYDLRHSTNESDWTVVNDVSDPETVSGLTADTLYYVQTRAVNAVDADPSNWSTSGTATTDAAASDPAGDILTLLGAKVKALYDATDFDSMKQNTGGSTAVTAAGQAVRYLEDLSGNGNHTTAQTGNALSASGYLDWNDAEFIIPVTSDFTSTSEVYALVDPADDADNFWLLLGFDGLSGIYLAFAQSGSGSAPSAPSQPPLMVDNVVQSSPTRATLHTAMTTGGGYKALGANGVNLSSASQVRMPLSYGLSGTATFGGRAKFFLICDALTAGERSDLQAIFDGAK